MSLLLNFIFAVSATITLIYLVFYSIGPKERRILEILHYSGILTLITFLAFVIVFYEFRDTQYQGPFEVFLVVGLAAAITMLIAIDLKLSQYVAFALIGALVTLTLALDYQNLASKRMVKLFYHPLFMEFLFVLFALILFAFRIPELCCPDTRWIHLYFNSQIILIIFTLNFLYELHGVYIRTIKLQEGSLSKEQQDSYI